jgi:hypothetical protein
MKRSLAGITALRAVCDVPRCWAISGTIGITAGPIATAVAEAVGDSEPSADIGPTFGVAAATSTRGVCL